MKRIFCALMCAIGSVFASDDGLSKESTIPVVDLQDYFNPTTRDQFLKDVRAGLHRVGFLGVKNTRVNQQIIDRMYTCMEEFFKFDRDLKMEVSAMPTNGQRGYVHFGGEAAKGRSVGDAKEYYHIGKEIDLLTAQRLNMYQNSWPSFYNLKDPAVAFYDHIEEYGTLFKEIFSLMLHQEKDFFKKRAGCERTICRMIYYPNIEEPDGAVWAAAHTDINLFTILPKSTAEGLEVLNDEGEWVPVFIKEDAFIINAGDILEAYSNGYIKSSMHRVRRPDNMDRDRYSCVFFNAPNDDTIVYPIEEWIEKSGGKRKFIEATFRELFMERMADNWQATDEMLKELADSKVIERLMEVDRASVDAMAALEKAGYASDKIKQKLKTLNKRED